MVIGIFSLIIGNHALCIAASALFAAFYHFPLAALHAVVSEERLKARLKTAVAGLRPNRRAGLGFRLVIHCNRQILYTAFVYSTAFFEQNCAKLSNKAVSAAVPICL